VARPRRRLAPSRLATLVLLFLPSQISCGHAPSPSYPLPTHPDTGVSGAALFTGTFSARLTNSGACAWLGTRPAAFLWPPGYRVRFHPTELIDPKGRVVGVGGERLSSGGGFGSSLNRSNCGPVSSDAWWVGSIQRAAPG
jgi:hypothetical protein